MYRNAPQHQALSLSILRRACLYNLLNIVLANGDLWRSPTAAVAFHETGASPYKKLIQVSVSPSSDLIGRSVRDIQWQGRFGTVLVGVQRGNGREDGRLSDIVVAARDVFILDTSELRGTVIVMLVVLLGIAESQAILLRAYYVCFGQAWLWVCAGSHVHPPSFLLLLLRSPRVRPGS